LIELEVAFVAFGVILAGLCPVVVAQLRHISKLESRFQAGTTYYINPRIEPWARKLAATAPVSPTQGLTPTAPPASPTMTVTVVELDASPNVLNATAYVTVRTANP
jgi:hypothetical protein